MNDTVKQILQDQKALILAVLNGNARSLTNAQNDVGLAQNAYNATMQKLNDVVSALGEDAVTVDPVTLQASLAISAQAQDKLA